jgi:hypothetical protein
MDEHSFRRVLYYASLYAFIPTALYLFGYWGTFNLNIFDFLGPTDLLTHALYPFLASILAVLLSFFIGHVAIRLVLFLIGVMANHEIPPSSWLRIVEPFRKFKSVIMLLAAIFMFYVIVFVPDPVRGILLLAPVLIFSLALMELDYFDAMIPNRQVRFGVIPLILLIPFLAFAYGRSNGYAVLTGHSPLAVNVEASSLRLHADRAHPVAYVGHLADFFILYESSDAHLVFLKEGEINSLVLFENPVATSTASSTSPTLLPSPTAMSTLRELNVAPSRLIPDRPRQSNLPPR